MAPGAPLAAPLDKAACDGLKGERDQLVAKGLDADMAKGPDWAKTNLTQARLEDIRRLIELNEQLTFRCGRSMIALPPLKLAPDLPAAALEDGPSDNKPEADSPAAAKTPPAPEKPSGPAAAPATAKTPPAQEKPSGAAPPATAKASPQTPSKPEPPSEPAADKPAANSPAAASAASKPPPAVVKKKPAKSKTSDNYIPPPPSVGLSPDPVTP